MVSQYSIAYGFNGYHAPHIPRAARSVRRRRKDDRQQMCAFDLLATVAGKLLSEGENFSPSLDSSSGNDQHITAEDSSSGKENDYNKERFSEEKSHREMNFILTELVSEDLDRNKQSYELGFCQNNTISGLTVSDCSEKVNDECKLQLGISVPSLDVDSSNVKRSSCFGSEDDEVSKKIRTDVENNRNMSVNFKGSPCSLGVQKASPCNIGVQKAYSCSLGIQEPLDRRSSALVSSADSMKFSVSKDQTTRGPVLNNRDNLELVTTKDDDENYSECFEPRYSNKGFNNPPLRVGDRRFKKILVSKHCRASADAKDVKRFNNPDTERCSYVNRKNILKRQRSIKDYPIKKRKLYDYSAVTSNEDGIGNDGTYRVRQNGSNGLGHCSVPTMPGAISNQGHASNGHAYFQSRNHQVKLRIRSFRVPELYIEIPETASVGCLKRAVMEAVNSVLGGGLKVGVLLQGMKIRDDGKTLLQTGISHNNKSDNLGFCLEPDNAPPPISICPPEDSPRQLLHRSPQPLARYPPNPVITPNDLNHHQGNLDSPRSIIGTTFNNFIEREHHRDSAPSSSDIVISQKASLESKAIVPLQTVKQQDAHALSVIPLRKCKRSESAQRRIRRPFTVAEVEALVQAVEKLGTGRWRDVKLRAFDHAKHRTYVDLKDKWKTLVHTARISPQQRRGEPVPQELLDRVLTAHAYWSQKQAKQQLKSQPDTCLLL